MDPVPSDDISDFQIGDHVRFKEDFREHGGELREISDRVTDVDKRGSSLIYR